MIFNKQGLPAHIIHQFREHPAGARLLFVSLLVLNLSVLHYLTGNEDLFLHVLYRELYFLPVILAGFWFGLRGGGLTALIIAVIYLPKIISNIKTFNNHDLANFLQIFLFIVIGLSIGWLRDRELRQQRLKEQEAHLASMGKAVACVAHDMKTPLVAIGGFMRQIRRKVTDESEFAWKIDLVLQQTKRLETMVGDMLVFSRPLELCCRAHCLNDLFRDTTMMLTEKAKTHNVSLHVHYLDFESSSFFDFDRLQQALVNLISNGIEACPENGEVIVKGRCDSNTLVMEIEDTGAGIPEHLRNTVFRPFVSAKKGGTGLGLAIVQKIITAHGGTIAPIPGEVSGTIFKITIPQGETMQEQEWTNDSRVQQ